MSTNTQHIATQIYAKFQHHPTPDQKKVIRGLATFLSEGCEEDIFVINGYAGTGKTTLLGAIVQGCGIPSVLLAPTGRAAKVLARHAGRGASTIHRRIYRLKDETTYKLDDNRAVETLFIVDEASMIDNTPDKDSVFGSGRLLDDLIQYVRAGARCKLLLVGDNAQLPPVKEGFSPALDRSRLEGYGRKIHYHTMSQVLRQQAGSTILRNATQLREILTSGQMGFPRFEVGGNLRTVRGSNVMEVIKHCREQYGPDETMVVTFSNATAVGYNKMIRSDILGRQQDIEVGDRLMVVKNNYLYPELDKGYPMDFLANGDVGTLTRLGPSEKHYGKHLVQARLRFDDNNYNLNCRLMLDTLDTHSSALDKDEQNNFYLQAKLNYPELGGRKLHDAINEDLYFNAVQIKYAYASTCHKAQGGQWKAVIIDSSFRGGNVSLSDLRWLYTALTRATEQVYLVNFDKLFFA